MTIDRIPISDIKIGSRFRKDLGDIDGLAKSIQEIGLLHPAVINQNNELIAGARRLEAYKSLGCTEIPVTVIDIKEIIHGELHENAIRKDFTISERIAILEEIEKQRVGHRQKKDTNLVSFQEENKDKRSVEIVSQYTGVSTGKLQMEKKIVQAARDEPEKWSPLLQRVEEGKTSVDYAHKMITRAEDHRNPPRLPEGRFDIIVADPPWSYDLSTRGAPDEHYQVMENEEIEQLPIPSADNAILFLWATAPKQKEAFSVMEAWGFKYKTNMVWVKDRIGNGYYVRGKHELLLIGEKGDMPVPEESNRPASVIESPRQEHSRKPEIVHEMIEKMYPNRSYLELFARSRYSEKWTIWGVAEKASPQLRIGKLACLEKNGKGD